MISKVFLYVFSVFAFACVSAAPTMAQHSTEQVPIKIPAPEPLLRDVITIRTQDNQNFKFNIELALTPQQQARGMMFRNFMAEDSGMLFLFKKEEPRSFWMKNTLIPLDLLFVAKDGEIHHVHSRAKPQDLTQITAKRPAMAVLEIKGGMADILGITPGDKILHPYFRNIVAE